MNTIRLPLRLMLFALALTLAVCGWLAWNTWDSYRFASKTKLEYLRLEQLRGVIVHLDEVLTMSARMAATTGDDTWEKRYRQYEPQLDQAIKDVMQLTGRESLGANAKATDEANLKLVEMENRAFSLVRDGKPAEARAVLFSDDYEKQKAVYAGGIGDLMARMDRRLNAELAASQQRAGMAVVVSFAAMAAMIIAWLTAILHLDRWRAALSQVAGRTEAATPALERAKAGLKWLAAETSAERRMEHLARAAAALALVVGGLVLMGWALDVAALKSILPGWVSVKPNTALAFVLTGIALWLQSSGKKSVECRVSSDGNDTASPVTRHPLSWWAACRRLVAQIGNLRYTLRRIAQACAGLVASIGALTLAEYLGGWDLGLDQWLFRELAGAVGTSHPGRMAPDTALCFVLLAVALWAGGGGRRTRWALLVEVVIGPLVVTVGLAAMLSSLTPGLGHFGWWNLTSMAVPTAAVFVVLGAAISLEAWRDALDPRFSQFSRNLLLSSGMVVLLAVAFALYARSEQQITRTQELRHQSFLLADELRQSGDDLTRMVRTYVVTGDPVYKRHFQDILDIRDGKKPRPEHPERPYWDLVLRDGPAPRASQQAIPLLELMRQAGFTEDEFRILAEAKANSDALTGPEFEAMKLVESTRPETEANRAKASKMLYDAKYHQAKAAVMKPIHDFFVLVDQRTLAAVHAAEHTVTIFRYILVAFGLGLLLVLWRAYVALGSTLGGSVDEVYAHIAKIGSGDFAAAILVKASLRNSVLGWLSETQAKLNESDRERKRADAALHAEITERKQAQEALARRMEDLAQFNAAAVGRELRMIELKQQVNDLARQLGQPQPYALEDLPGKGHSWQDGNHG